MLKSSAIENKPASLREFLLFLQEGFSGVEPSDGVEQEILDGLKVKVEQAAVRLDLKLSSGAQLELPQHEANKREDERQQALENLDRVILHTILNQSPHGILVCDAQGKIFLQNRASESIWAGSATANSVAEWGQYRAWHPNGRPYEPHDWAMYRCLTRQETIGFEEVHFQRFDGSFGYLLGSCAPLLDPKTHRLLGAVSVFGDITDIKKTEMDLARTVAQKNHLIEMVSHDLKLPLTAIQLNADLWFRKMQLGQDSEVFQKTYKNFCDSVSRMNRMIKDLLDLSRMEAGVFSVEVKPHAAEALIKDAMEMALPLAAAKAIRLENKSAEGLAEVLCDRERILQVFSNLLSNAIKFSPQNSTIRLLASNQGSAVCFEVQDQGNGIAPEEIPHVFDRYWRSASAVAQGTGIGLAITKGIIKSHQGSIWVESVLKKGSSFSFTLPALRP